MDSNFSNEKTSDTSENEFLKKYSKLELDIKIFQKLIEETVEKLTFAMTVPHLLSNDYKLIKTHISDRQLENMKQILKKYLPNEEMGIVKQTVKQSHLATLKSTSKFEDTYFIKTENIPQRDEYDFSNAFLILFNNEEIQKISARYKRSISASGFNFIQEIKYFFYTLRENMRLSPKEAETRETYLRKLCHHHQNVIDESQLLQLQALKQIQVNKELLKDKLNEVLNRKEKINIIMKACEDFVYRSGRDADKKMIFDWKNSEFRQDVLEEKVNKEMVNLEFLRKKYVEDEKELRTKRFKTEQHLISFLEQYDGDMQNKQNEVEAQQETLRVEKEQFDQLQERHEEQKIIYDLLMEEKRDYEKRLFEAKLYEFKCSSAARKIQRFYRNLKKLVYISGKKDLLGGKKKRKK